jgi:hypothetical protein
MREILCVFKKFVYICSTITTKNKQQYEKTIPYGCPLLGRYGSNGPAESELGTGTAGGFT